MEAYNGSHMRFTDVSTISYGYLNNWVILRLCRGTPRV